MLKIAISQRIDMAAHEERDALACNWSDFIANALPEAVLLPIPNRPATSLNWLKANNIDGLILSGGNDWGAKERRDLVETEAVRHCMMASLPIIGVCRGMQVINLLAGGSSILTTGHIPADGGEFHSVSFHGRMLDMAGGPDAQVNSYHRYAIPSGSVAPGFETGALSPDGLVEAVWSASAAVGAIMWHPERPGGPDAFNQEFFRAILRRREHA